MADYQQLKHEFHPVFDKNSQILILGTFPSVKSREQHFYYGHPQNRFWKVLAAVTKKPLNVIPADIPGLLTQTSITTIFGNGNKACELFEKYTVPALAKFPELHKIQKLPSTSPANASWSLKRLTADWQQKLSPYLIFQ